MRNRGSRHRRISLGALAALLAAGCGGLQTPASLPPAPQQRAAHAAHSGRVASWMNPDAMKTNLLYVSDDQGSVDVFSYPDGKPMGTLTGFTGPSGLCSDEKGDVFVTDTGNGDIVEYAHGATQPLATLFEFGVYPEGCSIDRTTGNLAVTNFGSNPSGPGSVAVFDRAQGAAHLYTDPNFNVYLFCGYDNAGNLYIDGVNSGTTQALLAVLPQGSTSFTDLTLNRSIGYPGGVQWDGKNLAIEDVSTDTLYRVKVSGSSGSVVGTTHLSARSHLLIQFWIQGRTIVVPYGTLNREVKKVGFWPYPAGGSPAKSIGVRKAAELIGATVSLAK
jgi:hypothetical protein